MNLSVARLLPALPLFLALACSRKDGETLIWEVPPVPGPVALEVEGEPVPEDLLTGFLEPVWADYVYAHDPMTQRPPLPAEVRDFFHDPKALFEPFVGDLLLLREAERRYPVLDEKEFADYTQRMEAAAGGPLEALRKRLGDAGVRAHIERRLRLEKISRDLGGVAEPTEEELLAAYGELRARLKLPEDVEVQVPTFQDLREDLRHKLLTERRAVAAAEWIRVHRKGVEARFTTPSGKTVVFSYED